MKVLNLDAVKKPKKILTFLGVDYEVLAMSVETFIEVSHLAQQIKPTDPFVKQVELMVDMISRCIPSIPVETLKSMDIEELTLLMSFVKGELDNAEEQGNAQ